MLCGRSPEAPNGVVEFMVASLMEQAASLGVRRVSLNFAMFGHIFEVLIRWVRRRGTVLLPALWVCWIVFCSCAACIVSI